VTPCDGRRGAEGLILSNNPYTAGRSDGIVSALYLFVYASDYPKTASHGRVAPDHKLFGPML